MTICQVFANIVADLFDDNSTAPTIMRCIWKRLVGSGAVKPSDFGIPRLKGKPERVRQKLKDAGFDESKLCFDSRTYGNFNDVFRHVAGALVGSYLVGSNLTHAQDWDNDRQRKEAEEKLKKLKASIGNRKPTKEEKAQIEKLEDRIAETKSENDCNHIGRKLWKKWPWTIFNTREYIYNLVLSVCCKCPKSRNAAKALKNKKIGFRTEEHIQKQIGNREMVISDVVFERDPLKEKLGNLTAFITDDFEHILELGLLHSFDVSEDKISFEKDEQENLKTKSKPKKSLRKTNKRKY